MQAEAGSLLARYTADEMLALAGVKENTLSQKTIVNLSYIKQKSVIRYWIKTAGFKAPSAIKLEHIITDVFNSVSDANPLVHGKMPKSDATETMSILCRRYQHYRY